jgi:hypothetical protein
MLISLIFLVILPPSALAKLTQLNIEYPMLFELSNKDTVERTTHGYVAAIFPKTRIQSDTRTAN